MKTIRSIYPRAFDKRPPLTDAAISKGRKAFFKAASLNFILLQLLFLGLFCYVFGSLYLQTTHIHNFNVVFVDYDGGAIGQAVRDAYASLRGKGFPTLMERSPSSFPSPNDLRRAVCRTSFWAAFFVRDGASRRLQEALAGTIPVAQYNTSDVMAYIWNEALYPTTVDSGISVNLQMLSEMARVAYSTGNGTGNLQSVSGPAALSVLADPWRIQSIDIQPTIQGSRTIYNTIVIILIMIQEFFFLATINGLSVQFKLYARVKPLRLIIGRGLMSLAYTFAGSLCVIGAIWAFRHGWHVNAAQFVLSWMVMWLFAHVNFLVLDVFSIWLPPPFVPMALVAWISMNVASILLPFDLSPAFYRLGYLFPAHEVYQSLLDIWSGGCNPQLHIALPVLFSWELLGLLLSAMGVFRRCHYAVLGEEAQAKEMQQRIDATVEEMSKTRATRRQSTAAVSRKATTEGSMAESPSTTPPTDEEEDGEDEEAMRRELTQVVSRVATQQRLERRRTSVACNFGPSFSIPFASNESDKEE